MGWRMHSHRLVMGVALLAGLVMIVGYLLLSGVPSSFLLGGALVQTSDVTRSSWMPDMAVMTAVRSAHPVYWRRM